MAFYLFALSCTPCICDDSLCNESKIEKKSSSKTKENEKDNCSPFCSCKTCPFSIILSKKVNSVAEISVLSNSQIFYPSIPIILSYNHHNIWQPPQLG